MPSEDLKTTDEQGALAELQALCMRFEAVPSVNVEFMCKSCITLYGCYYGDSNTICLNPADNGRIPYYVIWHEFGHAYQRAVTPVGMPECGKYGECEGFSRYFESLYLLTNGDILTTAICGCIGSMLRVLDDGSLQCLSCGTVFYVQLSPYLSQMVTVSS